MSNPTLVLFDVDETLSNCEPLRARFEAIGAPGQTRDLDVRSQLRSAV